MKYKTMCLTGEHSRKREVHPQQGHLCFQIDNSPQESASAVLINRAVWLTKSKKYSIQIILKTYVSWPQTAISRVFGKFDGITEEHGPCENKHRIYSNTLMSWLFAVSECQYEACNKS